MKYTTYLVLKKQEGKRDNKLYSIYKCDIVLIKNILRYFNLICGIQTIRNQACHRCSRNSSADKIVRVVFRSSVSAKRQTTSKRVHRGRIFKIYKQLAKVTFMYSSVVDQKGWYTQEGNKNCLQR